MNDTLKTKLSWSKGAVVWVSALRKAGTHLIRNRLVSLQSLSCITCLKHFVLHIMQQACFWYFLHWWDTKLIMTAKLFFFCSLRLGAAGANCFNRIFITIFCLLSLRASWLWKGLYFQDCIISQIVLSARRNSLLSRKKFFIFLHRIVQLQLWKIKLISFSPPWFLHQERSDGWKQTELYSSEQKRNLISVLF